ncbi:MAG TPA: hypothetical protein VJ783_25765 [Pirellulales bacterium]|nr:hypothetical protein [Pirellulales bacterium]
MFKEALAFVFDKTKECADKNRAQIFDVPGDERSILIEHNGQLVERKIPPPLRSHVVESVADLVAATMRWGADGTIWIDERMVRLVVSDDDRREFVTCHLKPAVVFSTARGLAKPICQADLVRLLRREFRDAIGAAEMLAAVRKLKFKQHSEGHSNITHGGESLGRTIENEVTGLDGLEVPELLTLETNVYSNEGERDKRYKLTLDLEIDPANQLFLFRPLPDEIERVVQAALNEIQARLSEALPDTSIFFGRP